MSALATYQLWARRDHAFGGTNITAWGEGGSLSAAEAASQSSDTFSFRVYRYAPVGGAAFAVNLVPGMQLYYVRVPLTGDPELVWAGRFKRQSEPNSRSDDFRGMIELVCTTPLHELKTVLERLTFNPTDHPTDISRAARVIEAANIPFWAATGITSTVSVTYQEPPPVGIGEAVTVYEFKSVEEILNDLRTDPGYPGDPDYPVPARTWAIRGELVSPSVVAAGVHWVLHYVAAADLLTDIEAVPDNATYTISDAGGTGTAFVLLEGSSYTKDASEIIRKLHVAGPKVTPIQPTFTDGENVQRGQGQVRKSGGTNDWGDCGARSMQRIPGEDWEAVCQVQELFLQHETFQGPDAPILIKSVNKTAWERLTSPNTLARRGGRGVPRLPAGLAQGALQAKASTCILRSEWIANRQGMQLLARVVDADNYWKLENVGAEYELFCVVAGVATSFGVLDTSVPADGDDVKISMIGDQFQCFINDGDVELQVTDDTHENATKHGLGVDCDAPADSYEAEFGDLEITDFWGDRAFGIGPNDTIRTWSDLDYGFIFNQDGSVTLLADGVDVGTTVYHYNDHFKIGTFNMLNMATRAYDRGVILSRLEATGADWEELYRVTDGVPIIIAPTPGLPGTPWYVQFAAKDLGATLNNIWLQKMYANLFVATSPPFSDVDGEWPANGIYQSDELDTYQKRAQYFSAFALMYAEAKEVFTGRIRANAGGEVWALRAPATVAITSRQRKWVDNRGTGGDDKRKLLWLKSVRRAEVQTDADYPNWDIMATSRDLEIDLQGPRHLQTKRSKTSKPANRASANQTTSEGDNITFQFEDPTGDENFGRYLEVQIAPQGQDDWEDSQWPVMRYDPNAAKISVPKAMLEPGVAHLLRHQTVDDAGNASGWAASIPFTAPKAETQIITPQAGVDNGLLPIPAGVLMQEITFPVAGRILSYEIKSQDVVEGVAIQLDVERATVAGRRDLGVGAFASIAGTEHPALPGPDAAPNFKDSATLEGWDTEVAAGDTVRFVVEASPTPTAQNVSIVLFVEVVK